MINIKSTLLTTLLVSSPMLHADILKLSNLTISDSAKLYSEAINAYNKKDYKSAYKYFYRYTKEKALDKRANFFYARSAYETAHYDIALGSYEKILLQEPDNLRVKLEIAQCYFRLNKFDKAKEQFNEVLKHDIPQNVRENIKAGIASIDKKNKKNFFQAALVFGLLYDSNIDNNADAEDYSIYVDGLGTLDLSNDGKKRNDKASQLIGVLNHTYKFDSNKAIENRFTAFTQNYSKHAGKDISVISIESAPAYYTRDYKAALAFGYDHVQLGHKDYLKNYSVTARLNKKINDTLNYQGYFKLNKKDFAKEDNKDKNSYTAELFNSLSCQSKDYGINTLSLTLGKDDSRQGSRTDVNKNYYTLSASNSYSISKTLILNSSLSYKEMGYKDEDINFLSKREDINIVYSIGILKSINKNISAGTNIQYIDNQSNHEPFEYDKYLVKGFVQFGF